MMINGIIKFIGSGLDKTATSKVSSQTVEIDNFLSELLKLLISESDDKNNDILLGTNAIFILPVIDDPKILNYFNQIYEQLSSGSNDSLASLNILKDAYLKSEKLNSLDIMNLSEKINSSEKFTQSEITAILKNAEGLSKISDDMTLDKFKNLASDSKLSEEIKSILQNNTPQKDENQVLLNSIIDNGNSKEENLLKNALKETSKGENFTITDKNLASSDIISANSKTIEKSIELPVFKINEVPEAIAKTLSTQNKTLIVQLEPPELGKIMIKLTLDNAGVRADLKVDYPHVKEMITGLIPEIKNNLQSSGIKLSDFVLDLMRDHREYRDSYQGQKRNRGNQKFIEYFA